MRRDLAENVERSGLVAALPDPSGLHQSAVRKAERIVEPVGEQVRLTQVHNSTSATS